MGSNLKKGLENKHIREVSAEESAYIERLYQKYHTTLVRFLHSINLDPVDANDIAQEAFYRVSRKPGFTAIEQPRAFLFRTAVNIVADQSRSRQRRRAHQHVDIEQLDEYELLNPTPTLERHVQAREHIAILKKAMRQLSPKCRDVIVMFKFEGMSQKEIARELNISVPMVQKYVARALAQMRNGMAAAGESGAVVSLANTGLRDHCNE